MRVLVSAELKHKQVKVIQHKDDYFILVHASGAKEYHLELNDALESFHSALASL